MPVAQKSIKQLRREARALGISDVENLDIEELEESIEERSTSKTEEEEVVPTETTAARKAAPTRKPATKASSTAKSNGRPASRPKKPKVVLENPFREGSNLFNVAEVLRRGGARKELVKELVPLIHFHPRLERDPDWNREEEIDRRLKAIGYLLKNKLGWEYTLEGRGPDSYLRVAPPSE